MIDLAKVSPLDQRLGQLGVAIEPVGLGHHHGPLHGPGRLDNL